MNVFISYGHDHFAPFALALAERLADGGMDVWIDRSSLVLEPSWDHGIEDGIRACDAFVLLMTPHSVGRTEGVCLDELAFARSLNKRILTVLVAQVAIPLLVQRIQAIDAQLTDASLDGQKASAAQLAPRLLARLEQPPETGILHWSAVLDHLFRSIRLPPPIDDYDVVGRDWLVEEIASWRTQRRTPLWLSGGPGIGKSAIATALRMRLGGLCALHTCRHYDDGLNHPSYAFLSLAAQLCREWSAYHEALIAVPGIDRLEAAQPDELFRVLFCEVPARLQAVMPAVVIIDGLDEAASGPTGLVALLSRHAGQLPQSVRLVVTGRDTPSLAAGLGSFERCVVRPSDPRHLHDMEAFAKTRLQALPNRISFVPALLTQAKGNFLFLKAVIDWIALNPHTDFASDGFPPSLLGIYTTYLDRCTTDHSEFETKLRPVLETLIACRQPPTAAMLAEMNGISIYQVNAYLDELGPLIAHEGASLAPFHKSFLDWLVNEAINPRHYVDRREGDKRLTEAARNVPAPNSPWGNYFGRHAVHHLWHADEIGALCELVSADHGSTQEQVAELLAGELLAFPVGRYSLRFDAFATFDHPFLKSIKVFSLGRDVVNHLMTRRAFAHLLALADRARQGGIGGETFARYIELRVRRANGTTAEVIRMGHALLPSVATLDDETIADIHRLLGDGYRESGRHGAARRHYQASVDKAMAKRSHRWFEAVSALADLDYVVGDLPAARKLCNEGLSLSGQTDDEPGRLLLPLFRTLGNIEGMYEAVPKALRHFESTLEIAMAGRRPFRELEARNSIADLLATTDHDRARREIGLARTMAEAHEAWLEYGKSYYIEGEVLLQEGNPETAIRSARRGLAVLTRVGYGSGRSRCWLVLAEAELKMGRTRHATARALSAWHYYQGEGIYPKFQLRALSLLSRSGQDQKWFSQANLERELTKIRHLDKLPSYNVTLVELGRSQ